MEASAALRVVVEVLAEKQVSRGLLAAGVAAALRAVCLPVRQAPSVPSSAAPGVVGEGQRLRRARAQRLRRLRKKYVKVLGPSAVGMPVEKVEVAKSLVVSGEVGVVASVTTLASSAASVSSSTFVVRQSDTTGIGGRSEGMSCSLGSLRCPQSVCHDYSMEVGESDRPSASVGGLRSGRSGRGRQQPSLSPEERAWHAAQLSLSRSLLAGLSSNMSQGMYPYNAGISDKRLA